MPLKTHRIRKMQIVDKKPFVATLYRLRFGKEVSFEDGVIFPFNNKIYTHYQMSDHLIVHEKVHLKQQGGLLGSMWWVLLYIASKRFRLKQELEAYRVQYKYIVKHTGREEANTLLIRISNDLSSEMYGNMISYAEAFKQIKQ